jgi:hypothetical protein
MKLPDPRYAPYEAWASRVYEELVGDGCPLPLDAPRWREWANSVIALPSLGRFEPLPWPESFNDWSEWAVRMVEAVTFDSEDE